MIEKTFSIPSEDEMLALGKRLGALSEREMFFALYGDLGAGKSVFARGFASAFGVASLTSPTFTIVSEYPTHPRLCHFDAYRLSDEDELYAIGFTDYLDGDSILLMEWANLVAGCLPKERMDIFIEGSGMQRRTVVLVPHGARYEKMLECL